jgi:quinol monooxygenase YgiN
VGRTENGNVGVWEIWTSQDAHERSLMDKETRAFVKQTMPLIKEIIPARQIDLRGGKGTPSPAR